MRIGLDLRFLENRLYDLFIYQLVSNLIKKDKQNQYTLYFSPKFSQKAIPGSEIKIVDFNQNNIKKNWDFWNFLKKQDQQLIIFFDHYKPLFYKKDYYVFVSSLKDVYYNNFSNIFLKYFHYYSLEKSLTHAQKILCFEETSRNELIERFNLIERKIHILPGFFPKTNTPINRNDIPLSINTKYNINNPFFIYSSGNRIEKNYEKLLWVLKKLHDDDIIVDLVFLWDDISKNIELRNTTLSLGLASQVHYLWELSPGEKEVFYKNAVAEILPSLYEPFAFSLTDAVQYKTPIIANKLETIKNIFSDSITYCSAISIHNIYITIKNYSLQKKQADYTSVTTKYSLENTTKEIIEIIN